MIRASQSTLALVTSALTAAALAAACSTASQSGPSQERPTQGTTPAAASVSTSSVGPEDRPAQVEPAPRDGSKDPFAADVMKAALEYRLWRRVDERPGSAPYLCAYWPPRPSTARQSEPEAGVAHGKKLYFLHASDVPKYTDLASSTAELPIGFTIVKESYRAVALDARTTAILAKHPDLRLDAAGKFYRYGRWVLPIAADDAKQYGLTTDEISTQYMFEVQPLSRRDAAAPPPGMIGDRELPTAPPQRVIQVGGTWMRTGEQADLFVMKKVAKGDAPGTDRGWVYGVVSADGAIVRQSGKLEHCAGCHQKAPHDRLFATAKPDDSQL